MIKFLIFVIVAIIIPTISFAQFKNPNPVFKELGYAICYNDQNGVSEIKMGIKYIVTGKPNKEIRLTEVWTPPLGLLVENANHQVWSETIRFANDTIYSWNTISQGQKNNLGKWKYQVFFNGKSIGYKEFIVR